MSLLHPNEPYAQLYATVSLSGTKDARELRVSHVRFVYCEYHSPLLGKTTLERRVRLLPPARGAGREMPFDRKAPQSTQTFAFDLKPHIFTWEKCLNH